MLDSKPRDIARALSRDKPMSQSTRVFESQKIENRIDSEKVEAESDRDDTDHFSSDVNEAMGRIKYLKKRKRLRWKNGVVIKITTFFNQNGEFFALVIEISIGYTKKSRLFANIKKKVKFSQMLKNYIF